MADDIRSRLSQGAGLGFSFRSFMGPCLLQRDFGPQQVMLRQHAHRVGANPAHTTNRPVGDSSSRRCTCRIMVVGSQQSAGASRGARFHSIAANRSATGTVAKLVAQSLIA